MRYPAAETAEKHERILDEASRLFRDRGFSGVSVGEIMKATGLTHGPFYNHFASKEALMSQCLAHTSVKALKDLETASASAKGKTNYIAGYLSTKHRDDAGHGCLIAALASEIGRQPAVKRSLTDHLKATIKTMSERFPWSKGRGARADTIRALSSMVGGLILARAVDDEKLSREILQEVMAGFN